MQWFYSGSTSKSLSALDDLVQDVLLATDFKREDLVGFRAAREAERVSIAAARADVFQKMVITI